MQGALVVVRWPRSEPLDTSNSSKSGSNVLPTADSDETETERQHLACTCDVSDANNALLHDRHLRVLACKERDRIAKRPLSGEPAAALCDSALGAEGRKEELKESGAGTPYGIFQLWHAGGFSSDR